MFAVNIDDNDQLADEITTLAGQINAAFEKGELSFSKVRAMTRIATLENESNLLMIANHGTAQHMEVLVRAYRHVSPQCDADEAFNNNEKQADNKKSEHLQDQRKVSCYQDDDGMWHIQATLPAEEGGILVQVLKELGDRLVAEASQETEIVTAVTSFPQRRADALVAIAEHYLATGSGDAANLKASDRCQLILHVQSGANLDGQWLPPDAARRLACDASFRLVKEDEQGNVLDIGRRSRVISSAMSRALTIRDGGCQFSGCCESRYVDEHHIKHWAIYKRAAAQYVGMSKQGEVVVR